MRFTHDLGDDYALALRTPDTAEECLALTLKNLDRLRRWEHWALAEHTLDDLTAFMRAKLEEFAAGQTVPCNIYAGDRIVGFAALRMDQYHLTAELGYWLDAEFEGRGIVTRACRALIEYGEQLGMRRFVICCAVENARSGAVAERLGFAHEGVLRGGLRVGDRNLDAHIYGRLAPADAPA